MWLRKACFPTFSSLSLSIFLNSFLVKNIGLIFFWYNNSCIEKEIDFFVDKLKKKFALPVLLEKEFLTSVEARRYEDEGETDAKAAALILQRYLDKRNTKHDILIKA